jgi:glycosyltransferase involved in cell wall biosynthesis
MGALRGPESLWGEMVSVIMPNFNGAPFLGEAIGSVLAQSYRPLELIVVDDGSIDGSRQVAARYGDRVTLIPVAHTGLPGLVRNHGLRAARGGLVAFLDSDDVWRSEKLALQVAYLEARPEVGLVHSNLQVIDGAGRYLRDIFMGCPGSRGLSDDYPEPGFVQLLNGDSGIWTSSVLARRQVLDRLGGFDETLTVAEDYDLWIRIAREFRIGFIPEPLAKHRKHGGNTGTSWAPSLPLPQVRLWTKMLHLYPDLAEAYGPLIHAKCLFHHVVTALHCARRGRYVLAGRLLSAGLAAHLPRTRYAPLKRTAEKYLMIRRLQRRAVAGTNGR